MAKRKTKVLTNTHEIKREEFIKQLRHKAGSLQLSAFIFLTLGLTLMLVIKKQFMDKVWWFLAISLFFLLLGISLEVSALIYFNKVKKHLSSQSLIDNN